MKKYINFNLIIFYSRVLPTFYGGLLQAVQQAILKIYLLRPAMSPRESQAIKGDPLMLAVVLATCSRKTRRTLKNWHSIQYG
jgi:hypothetical protein